MDNAPEQIEKRGGLEISSALKTGSARPGMVNFTMQFAKSLIHGVQRFFSVAKDNLDF